ncbi:MAG TPA: DUF4331 family protein [Ktedonobacteraceae bacterium]
MSHHLSGPNLRLPEGDARLDLTDVFAFQASTPGRTVLAMNVNPFAPAQAEAFHPGAVYQLNIDTNHDAAADITFSFVFSQPWEEEQSATIYYATGEEARNHGAGGQKILNQAQVCFDSTVRTVQTDDLRFFAGLRSDPFFADLDGIVNHFKWTGVDSMADANVFGLVLEVPDELLGANPVIGVWARVSLYRAGQLISVDRGAHPSLTAYFNPEEARDEYNAREPADDIANYLEPWARVLQRLGGYTYEEATQTLTLVLPDILRFDRSQPAKYPNGRTLRDDVTSARLVMISGGRITSDHIPPHRDLLHEFPYLGAPHVIPILQQAP